MIPLCLVTGFLGSGKTTLLRCIVETNRHRRLVYVVNECGAADVDGRLLAVEEERLVRIPGGSIFCRCLAGEFIDWLERIPRLAQSPDNPVAGVVVEVSGIADPKVARQLLRETHLDRTYDLRRTLSVIDPGTFLKLIHTLPNITAQIEACDLAIINKIDLYPEETLLQTEAAVHRLNPAAGVTRTRFGRIDVDIFARSPARELDGRYAGCMDPNYATTTLWIEREVDPDQWLGRLESLGQDLYRAKGFLPVAGGSLYVDWSESGLSTRPATEAVRPGMLVLISRPTAQACIDQFVSDFGPQASA